MLEKMIEKKCMKISEVESKLHASEIRSEKESIELAASTIRYCDTENNMRASNVSSISRKSQVSDYMKMDKS